METITGRWMQSEGEQLPVLNGALSLRAVALNGRKNRFEDGGVLVEQKNSFSIDEEMISVPHFLKMVEIWKVWKCWGMHREYRSWSLVWGRGRARMLQKAAIGTGSSRPALNSRKNRLEDGGKYLFLM